MGQRVQPGTSESNCGLGGPIENGNRESIVRQTIRSVYSVAAQLGSSTIERGDPGHLGS